MNSLFQIKIFQFIQDSQIIRNHLILNPAFIHEANQNYQQDILSNIKVIHLVQVVILPTHLIQISNH